MCCDAMNNCNYAELTTDFKVFARCSCVDTSVRSALLRRANVSMLHSRLSVYCLCLCENAAQKCKTVASKVTTAFV